MKRALLFLCFLVACGGGATSSGTETDGGADAGDIQDSSADAGRALDASDAATDSGTDAEAIDADVDADAAPLPKAAQPAFFPAPGTYTAVTTVAVASATTDSTIHYTLDGMTPTAGSPVLQGGVLVDETTVIRAIAVKDGFADSEVTTGTYTINISGSSTGVSFSPPGGSYVAPLTVTLQCSTGGATICYTLDGSTPACAAGSCQASSLRYAAPFTIDAPATVHAMSCKNGFTNSGVSQAEFDLSAAAATATPGYALAPILLDAPGEPIVLETTTKGATIHFTLDGSTPTCSAPDSVTNGGSTPAITQDTTLKTIVCAPGFGDSDEVDFEYVVE